MLAYRFDRPKKKIDLDEIPTEPPEGMVEEEARDTFSSLGEELFDLQDLLFGARRHSVLMVLQGRDTAGKDGTVKHVVGCLNPRGVRVVSFGVPTDDEAAHDFLWRIHRHTPGHGEVVIFNRSHYEDVLVARVHDLVPKKRWKTRYDAINAFEETLVEHGTIILKFFLHISREEQLRRLLEREEDPAKAWKLNVRDWQERARWKDYTRAYNAAIGRCATAAAPWYVIPADKKWFRNLAVAEALAAALRPYRANWRRRLEEVGAAKAAEIRAFREDPPGPSPP